MSRRTAIPLHKTPLASGLHSGDSAKQPLAQDQTLLRFARWALALAIVAAALAVDPRADAAFDAPKFLALKFGAIAVICALLLQTTLPLWSNRWTLSSRWVVVLWVAAVLCAVAATIWSVHGAHAWRSLGSMLVGSLYLIIGASRVVEGVAGKRFLALFIGLSAVNATLSLLQSMGAQLPFAVERLGGRYPTGALLGNEGFVALLCVLMGACGVALLFAKSVSPKAKKIAVAITVLAIVTITVNRQATSAIALTAALGVILAVKYAHRWLLALSVTLIALAVVAAVVPSLRSHTWAAAPGTSVESYQRLTTYRLGGWLAAIEMAQASPWIGHGPGAFAQESTARRLTAEVRHGVRLVQPAGATFVYGHQEWLQLAAECGIPAMFLTLAALGIVFQRLTQSTTVQASPERMLLLAVITAGSVATLAWFPLQIPITAMALLLACGRAWRLSAHTAVTAP